MELLFVFTVFWIIMSIIIVVFYIDEPQFRGIWLLIFYPGVIFLAILVLIHKLIYYIKCKLKKQDNKYNQMH